MLSLHARLAALAAATLTTLIASPVTLALAAGATTAATTRTVADPYGENTPVRLDTTTTAAGGPGTTGGSLVKTVVGLAIVIAVIYGLTWVLRQVRASKEERGFGRLHAEATVPLGPGRAVHLIRAGSEFVLVGSAEHGVSALRTYSEQEALDLGLLDAEDEQDDAIATRRRTIADRMRERTLR